MESLDSRIAKVLGWRMIHVLEHTDPPVMVGIDPANPHALTAIPKWSSSLDLMHVLEEGLLKYDLEHDLGYGLFPKYRDELERIVKASNNHYAIHATAAQKAKAWLKVREKV